MKCTAQREADFAVAVPAEVDDRALAPDANRIREWMATGEFLKAVEGAAGRLA